MLRQTARKLVFPVLKPLAKWYYDRPHVHKWKDLKVAVLPGVFHPGLYPSTTFMLEFLEEYLLEDYEFLELGAGCGLISVYAARRGAKVTASDISLKSTVNVLTNAKRHDVEIKVVRSDLFDEISTYPFDYIVVNPPTVKQNPEKEEDYAFCCGENLEYFQSFFIDLASHMHEHTKVFMILPAEFEIKTIRVFAANASFQMKKVFEKSSLGERCVIFEIQPDPYQFSIS